MRSPEMSRALRHPAPYPSRSLHGQIVHTVGRRILSGALRPGQPVEVGPGLRPSRTALREALMVLAAKGLVELRPKTGTRVRPREAWHLLDPDVLAWQLDGAPRADFLRRLTEVRHIVEPAAAALGARRATPEAVAEIASSYREMEAAVEAKDEDLERFVDADMRFHTAILRASGNDLLERIVQGVSTPLLLSFDTTSRLPGRARASLPRHAAILDAIRQRRGLRARAAMLRLVERTGKEIADLRRSRAASRQHRA
jgi:DNA-binding FadR family transcriptional regulator